MRLLKAPQYRLSSSQQKKSVILTSKMHIIITSSLLWSFLISVEMSKPHMPSKMPSMLLKFLIQPKWKVNAVWCIRANHPTAASETRKWLRLILQHSLNTQKKKKKPLTKKLLEWSIWTQFWPRKSGIWTNQSSKVQMRGGSGNDEASNWSAHRSNYWDVRNVTLTLTVFFHGC